MIQLYILRIKNKNVKQALTYLKQDFEIIIDWFMANKLSLNLSKTNYIIFKPKSLNVDNINNLELNFENQKINRVDVTKFLGIFIDSNLEWTAHVEHVCSQLSKSLYILKKC